MTAPPLPPPAIGPLAYNSFTPAASYKDSVFGSTVLRVTQDHARDDIYARNMAWNSTETRYLHRTQNVAGKMDAWDVIDVPTGRVTHTGLPFGSIAADGGFDAVDPDVIYTLYDTVIRRHHLKSNGAWTTSTLLVAPSPLLELGGSINWIDASSRYILARFGPEPSVYLYDLADINAGPYAGAIDASATVGRGSYLGLAPDGNHIVGFDSRPGVGVSKVGQGLSWWIDHGNRRIATVPTVFWSLCGDHGAFACASDGRTYFVTYNCFSKPGLWRVDITNNADGLDEQGQLALPNNKLLMAFETWNDFGHVTCVARGPLRDWAFFSTEDATDHTNTGAANAAGYIEPWRAWRQEILAINIITGELRGLAHHRSRSIGDDYYAQPRLSCSWEGTYVGWPSNFNRPGVVDIFAIPFGTSVKPPTPPAAPPPAPPPAPTILPITITLGGKTYTGTVVEA